MLSVIQFIDVKTFLRLHTFFLFTTNSITVGKLFGAFTFFAAQRIVNGGICYRNVCLFVLPFIRHTRASCLKGSRYQNMLCTTPQNDNVSRGQIFEIPNSRVYPEGMRYGEALLSTAKK